MSMSENYNDWRVLGAQQLEILAQADQIQTAVPLQKLDAAARYLSPTADSFERTRAAFDFNYALLLELNLGAATTALATEIQEIFPDQPTT